MLINLRNALMAGKRLPYDAEVEYLQSSGTQYIASGITPNQDSTVEITCRNLGTVGMAFFGARESASAKGFTLQRYANGKLGAQFNGAIAQPTDDDGEWHVLKLAKRELYIDDVLKYTFNSLTFTCPVSAYIFANNNNGTVAGLGNMMIASCRIWQNNTLVRDFIPVRVGTVGYLYDRVSGKLFGNAGTGDFVLGPDKN
jgi:hypothetical protein